MTHVKTNSVNPLVSFKKSFSLLHTRRTPKTLFHGYLTPQFVVLMYQNVKTSDLQFLVLQSSHSRKTPDTSFLHKVRREEPYFYWQKRDTGKCSRREMCTDTETGLKRKIFLYLWHLYIYKTWYYDLYKYIRITNKYIHIRVISIYIYKGHK